MSSQHKNGILVLMGVGLLLFGILKIKGSPPETLVGDSANSKEKFSQIQKILPLNLQKKLGLESDAKLKLDAKAKSPAANAEADVKADVARSQFWSQEIREFHHLKSKVFKTREDQAQLQQMLEDPQLLNQVAQQLHRPLTSEEGDDSAAVDLLLEARHYQKAEFTGILLKDLIQDQKLESPTLSAKERRILAERKAEVLYLWIAQEPQVQATASSWMKGRLSEKILKSVQARMEANQSESQSLASARGIASH